MKKWIFLLAVVLLLGVFGYSGYQLLSYYTASAESQSTYDDLLALKGEIPPATPTTAAPEVQPEAPTAPEGPAEPRIPAGTVAVTHPETGEIHHVLPEFQELWLLNPDLVGWISVEGTHIDYPVVQSAANQADYYLKRDFYGKRSSHGCIYAREQCDILKPSDNITIYGHRMNDLTMFGDLGKFKRQSFWEEHRYVRFDSLWERGTYEIIAVFQTQAAGEDYFSYHTFVDAADEAEFREFWERCKALALFDTGLEAKFGDKLITLSTCDYHEDNGRLVVVAKRIE